MKTIKFTAYLFYRYYSKGGTKDTCYFSTLCAMALIAFFHLMQFLILTDLFNTVIPSSFNYSRSERYLFWALISLPIFIFLALLIRERELKELKYSAKKIKKGNILLITYIILNIALLIFIAETKRKF